MHETRIGSATLALLRGDITDQDTDAIVNAANTTLMGGGGVDGAIHARGGPAILEACKRVRQERFPEGLPPGDAVITTAGALAAQYVIHTVGPIWRGGSNGEPDVLARAYHACLRLAAEEGLHSVSFPSISTGAYGYPKAAAARVALSAIVGFLRGKTTLTEIRVVLFSDDDLNIYSTALDALLRE